MQNFIFDIPTKVYFGKDQIENLGNAIKEAGASKILLAYGGGSIKKIGVYDSVLNQLNNAGIEYVELPGIQPNPRVESVREGARLCKENNLDLILAVGGGSTIDAVKAMAAAATYDGDVMDLLTGKVQTKDPLKLASVLTFSGTASELNGGCVVTAGEDHKKYILVDQSLFPTFSILDPTYTYSVSKYQTAAGAADIISHLMEQYFHPEIGTEVVDFMNEGILRAVLKYAPVAVEYPNNYDARAALMWASSMALGGGILRNGKSPFAWPVHLMGHELSSLYDMTHGVTLALLTPSWMRYTFRNAPESLPLFARFARHVFFIQEVNDQLAAEKGVKMLEEFFGSIGIPANLKEAGVEEGKLEYLAEKSVEWTELGVLKKLAKDDVWHIFKMAY